MIRKIRSIHLALDCLIDFMLSKVFEAVSEHRGKSYLVDYGPPIGQVYVHSSEDLILYKLIYFGLSQQTKHSRDIAAILRAKKNDLDFIYIEKWVTRL